MKISSLISIKKSKERRKKEKKRIKIWLHFQTFGADVDEVIWFFIDILENGLETLSLSLLCT